MLALGESDESKWHVYDGHRYGRPILLRHKHFNEEGAKSEWLISFSYAIYSYLYGSTPRTSLLKH